MLKDQIQNDLKTAIKNKDALKLSTLRMIKAAIINYEVSGADKEATDDVVLDLLKKEAKRRKEASEAFDKGGNTETAEKERKEAEIINTYLPEQMGEEQIRDTVREVIAELAPNGPADFGKVMGEAMSRLKGRADGGLVNKVVKELMG